MTFSYLIWNGSSEIFSVGFLSLRWYGLLFALGFIISMQLLYYMFKKEGKPEGDVDTLTIYMVIATILGARLGHVIFYQPELFWEEPLTVLLPFELSPFRFTGLQGLASHGGAIGILVALWVYANYSILFSKPVPNPGATDQKVKLKRGLFITKRKKPGQSYIETLDRIAILVLLTGALIRLGNFFNAEIIGVPTNGPLGIVFTGKVSELMTRSETSPVEFVTVVKNNDLPEGQNGRKPIQFRLFFKKGTREDDARSFLNGDVKRYLVFSGASEYVDEPVMTQTDFTLVQDEPGMYSASVNTFGIARHAAQLYESISCAVFFVILFWLWSRRKAETRPGLIFGWFMVILWTLRFSYEFVKESQVSFENDMPLNMGQILSIPFFIIGIVILVNVYRKKTPVPGVRLEEPQGR
jgi:phosphatidylglycerol:prolipoprotein diacylglycerol transferase